MLNQETVVSRFSTLNRKNPVNFFDDVKPNGKKFDSDGNDVKRGDTILKKRWHLKSWVYEMRVLHWCME